MNWSDGERDAIRTFLNDSSSVLRFALEEFTAYHCNRWRTACAENMATVPRNPELAADYAAKAQAFAEFWLLLEESSR